MPQQPAILDALRQMCDGLLFISETEAELTPFSWQLDGPFDEKAVRANPVQSYEPETPLETTTLDAFFLAVPPENRPQFDALARLLKANLKELRVYKLGEIEKDVYIVGKAADGSYTGIRTSVVET
jgi:hypothetical protein